MKLKNTIPIMVTATVFLSACGGSDGNSSTPKYHLSGTVPGTLIEAFCDNGAYYKVKSTKNGTGKHPFDLALPTNISCRVVMTTNEDSVHGKVITPVKISTNQGISGIAFKSDKDVNLGHVDLSLSRDTMTADTNHDGVEDEPKEVVVAQSSITVSQGNDPLDKDNDGIINVYEDDDKDGINNNDDPDDDNDGILDKNDPDHANDRDGDGITNKEDADADNDGEKDKDEDKDKDRGDKDKDDDDDDDNNDHDNDGGGNGNVDPTTITTVSAGRLLASQCAQCHRTDANPNKGFEDLIGEDIYGELMEMKGKNKQELMHLQAKGYTDQQIRLMDDYFRNLTNKGGK